MKKCLNCGKDVKNKYCDVTCQNKHQGKQRNEKIYGEYKLFDVSCNKCRNIIQVREREKLFPKKEKYFCSLSCANSRIRSQETREKISKTLKEKAASMNIKRSKNEIYR